MGHEGIVKLLLENGANVNNEMIDHSTPLHAAVQMGHFDVTERLLKHPAIKINAKARGDLTPLHAAVVGGREDIVGLLLQYGADVKDKNDKGNLPLHFLVQSGDSRVGIAKLLLQYHAEVDARNNDGFTPLHAAAQYGYFDLVQLFLQRGADVNAKNNNGNTPLTLALEKGNSEVVELFLDDPNINVGCAKALSAKKEEDKEKILQKLDQDNKLFNLIKQAAEIDENKVDELLKEIEELLQSKSEHGFKPSLNYSPDGSNENTIIEIAIKAGGKLLQLLYDYAKENIGEDTEIFKRLKQAIEQEKPQSKLYSNTVSRPSNPGLLIG